MRLKSCHVSNIAYALVIEVNHRFTYINAANTCTLISLWIFLKSKWRKLLVNENLFMWKRSCTHLMLTKLKFELMLHPTLGQLR